MISERGFPPSAEQLTPLERDVIQAMGDRDREGAILRQQAHGAKVASREHTAFGFFTNLLITDETLTLDRARRKIEDMPQAFASHPSLPSGALFILWLEDGRIKTLEGVTNEGRWPENEAAFRVHPD